MISNRKTPEQTLLQCYFAQLALLYNLYCHRLNEKIVTTCNDFLAMILTQFRDNSLELVFGVNTCDLLNDLTVFLE